MVWKQLYTYPQDVTMIAESQIQFWIYSSSRSYNPIPSQLLHFRSKIDHDLPSRERLCDGLHNLEQLNLTT